MEARDLRVSDAEREHVGQLLQRAVGQGMLSLGEFTERMDTALAAKTRGELNAVLSDLPGMRIKPEYLPDPASVRPVPPAAVPGYPPRSTYPSTPVHTAQPHPGEPGSIIRGRMSTVTRKGPWHVPPTLYIDSRLSSITLDFSEALIPTQVVEVTIDDYLSSVTLVVPEHATVDLNGVETIGGSAINKVRSGPPMGPLHLAVRGRVRFGNVTATHPFGVAMRKVLGGSGS